MLFSLNLAHDFIVSFPSLKFFNDPPVDTVLQFFYNIIDPPIIILSKVSWLIKWQRKNKLTVFIKNMVLVSLSLKVVLRN